MRALICFLLVPGLLFSQTEKGAALIAAPQSPVTGTTRAVVVGISDYQSPDIPDLRFADRDAEAFADWLRSAAGGGLAAQHVQLLKNDQARLGNIVAALTWLLDDCKAGERAVLYFSGHGDVEKATMFQRGYLLAYDMPPTNYMAGGINVRDVQDVVSTLSNRGVQVLMFTDACRAGKLAGSETGGAQSTASALAVQFANEVKLLSCQPDEFSLEGEQWGGGRGAFSFHLVEGLSGLADRNGDGQVSLLEIGQYLQEAVPRETAPHSQIPFAVGNPKTPLATVSQAVLASLKTKKAGELPTLTPIEPKGTVQLALARADSSIRELYAAFEAALARGELMPPASGGRCADDYFRALVAEPSIAELHGYLRRNFAAALQNEAQVVTNKLLKTDPQVATYVWSKPFVFDHIPAYLARAAEILGEDHFFYKHLKAKQLFFEGKTCRQHHPGLAPDSLLRLQITKFERALGYDSMAAYVYVDLGFLCFFGLSQIEKTRACAEKALALSPNWVYAHYLAAHAYRHTPLGLAHAQRALELDSTFLLPYQELAMLGGENGARYRDKYIQKVSALIASDSASVPPNYRSLLGAELWRAGRYEEAERELLVAGKLTLGLDPAVHYYLGINYISLSKYEKALAAFEKTLELTPLFAAAHLNIIFIHQKLNQPEKVMAALERFDSIADREGIKEFYPTALLAEEYLKAGREREAKALFAKILERLPDFSNPYDMNMVGRAHLGLGNMEAMERTIAEGLKRFPDDPWTYYQTACLYALAKQERESLEWLELALQKNVCDYFSLSTDLDFENVRQSDGFKALMKKYFPAKN